MILYSKPFAREHGVHKTIFISFQGLSAKRGSVTKAIFVPIITFSLSGCLAMYQVPPNAKTAEFFLTSENDTPKGSTLNRGTYFWVFKDEDCARSDLGIRADLKFEDENVLTTAALKVLANEKFAFTARYVEGRFGQHRTCSITAAFFPKPDHKYRASLKVRDNVGACNLEVHDVTSGNQKPIDFSMPKFVCLDNGRSVILNGQPVLTNVTVKVTTVPAK